MEKNVTGRATVLDDRTTFIGAALALGGTGKAIELQEALGAKDVQCSDRFPLDRRGISDDQLTAIGCVLGPKIDDLFQSITLPPGWKKDATGHDMWTYIVDEKGRKRFSIFYKAAIYDRSAHMDANRRFVITQDYTKGKKTRRNHIVITDAEKIIKRFDGKLVQARHQDKTDRAFYVEQDALNRKAQEWLCANYPDYEDWTAYWNS